VFSLPINKSKSATIETVGAGNTLVIFVDRLCNWSINPATSSIDHATSVPFADQFRLYHYYNSFVERCGHVVMKRNRNLPITVNKTKRSWVPRDTDRCQTIRETLSEVVFRWNHQFASLVDVTPLPVREHSRQSFRKCSYAGTGHFCAVLRRDYEFCPSGR